MCRTGTIFEAVDYSAARYKQLMSKGFLSDSKQIETIMNLIVCTKMIIIFILIK